MSRVTRLHEHTRCISGSNSRALASSPVRLSFSGSSYGSMSWRQEYDDERELRKEQERLMHQHRVNKRPFETIHNITWNDKHEADDSNTICGLRYGSGTAGCSSLEVITADPGRGSGVGSTQPTRKTNGRTNGRFKSRMENSKHSMDKQKQRVEKKKKERKTEKKREKRKKQKANGRETRIEKIFDLNAEGSGRPGRFEKKVEQHNTTQHNTHLTLAKRRMYFAMIKFITNTRMNHRYLVRNHRTGQNKQDKDWLVTHASGSKS